MPTSILLYGATRAGKSHQLAQMRRAGRLIVGDADGKFAAECPDAYTVEIPPPSSVGDSNEAKERRNSLRDANLAEAAQADVVVWPIHSPMDVYALQAALAAGRLGDAATLGLDSLTFIFESLIARICGISVFHKKGSADEEAIDRVMLELPDFTGAGVKRAMEKTDWQRFAQKAIEIVVGCQAICQRRRMHFVCTALEEKRDIIDQKSERLIETRMGPLIQGRAAGPLIPPKFGLFFRLASVTDERGTRHGLYTQPANGWPAGVVGKAAQLLEPCILNPNLWDILGKVGLQ